MVGAGARPRPAAGPRRLDARRPRSRAHARRPGPPGGRRAGRRRRGDEDGRAPTATGSPPEARSGWPPTTWRARATTWRWSATPAAGCGRSGWWRWACWPSSSSGPAGGTPPSTSPSRRSRSPRTASRTGCSATSTARRCSPRRRAATGTAPPGTSPPASGWSPSWATPPRWRCARTRPCTWPAAGATPRRVVAGRPSRCTPWAARRSASRASSTGRPSTSRRCSTSAGVDEASALLGGLRGGGPRTTLRLTPGGAGPAARGDRDGPPRPRGGPRRVRRVAVERARRGPRPGADPGGVRPVPAPPRRAEGGRRTAGDGAPRAAGPRRRAVRPPVRGRARGVRRQPGRARVRPSRWR